MPTALVYDPVFLEHDTGRHPENAWRLKVIIEALETDETVWPDLDKLSPRDPADEDIARCHSSELLEHVRLMCERGAHFIEADTRICADSYRIARFAAGAALAAVDEVMRGEGRSAFALVRPPGHHATPTDAMGFCLFNNAAIAARYAQARHGVETVLIIDWDVHHGNGTQDIFYEDPTVFYFSSHQYPYYPGTGSQLERGEGRGEGYTLNIPLTMGTSARAHREAFEEGLKQIEQRFHPDLIIISAGFDSRRGDPLGGLLLEDSDFAEMTRVVKGLAERYGGGRVVSVLEGGYNLSTLGQTVKTHVAALQK
ncbi:MAG TPA: histone deacetylase [Blastocatellia bacterium]|nr:histone deacetylase [Blastocatellia bacterium]